MRGLLVALLVLGLATSIDGLYDKDSKVISLDDKVRQMQKVMRTCIIRKVPLLGMLSLAKGMWQQSHCTKP
jgi:hypothetical protein